MVIEFLRSLVRIRLVGSTFLIKKNGKESRGKKKRDERQKEVRQSGAGGIGSEIHCGVVGNIQAFHVCAPGSIPGDGILLKKREVEKGK